MNIIFFIGENRIKRCPCIAEVYGRIKRGCPDRRFDGLANLANINRNAQILEFSFYGFQIRINLLRVYSSVYHNEPNTDIAFQY